jgi:hypothetical protein
MIRLNDWLLVMVAHLDIVGFIDCFGERTISLFAFVRFFIASVLLLVCYLLFELLEVFLTD